MTHAAGARFLPAWLLAESSLLIITLPTEQLSSGHIPGAHQDAMVLCPQSFDSGRHPFCFQAESGRPKPVTEEALFSCLRTKPPPHPARCPRAKE